MAAPGISERTTLSYFTAAFVVTAIGLGLGLWLGFSTEHTTLGALKVFFIVSVLAVLEISLSFDNAIVNANKLKDMTPLWQRRFLTWGIIIAVFGMRIVFPLLIVVIAANVGPWTALVMAASQPERYAEIMHDAHLPIAAFGGTFLMMVGLSFFFDSEKDVHWVRWIEQKAANFSSIKGIEIAFVLVIMLIFSKIIENDPALGPAASNTFFHAAIWGLLTFLMVEVLGAFLTAARRCWKARPRAASARFCISKCWMRAFPLTG